MEIHPAADLFPQMGADEYQGLLADLKENGLREPIVLYRERVLDGRGRLQACAEAGIEPRFRNYAGSDPYAYSISVNLHRRSLTLSQRAAIAAEAREALMQEGRRRQGWRRGNTLAPKGAKVGESGRSAQIAAARLGVGRRQVERAWKIKEEDPELFNDVKEGVINVGAATRKLEKRKNVWKPGRGKRDRTKPYVLSSTRTEELAKAQLRRLVQGLSEINGICRGLKEVDYHMAAAVCTPEELADWAAMAGKLSAALRTLKTDLEGVCHAPEAQPGSVSARS